MELPAFDPGPAFAGETSQPFAAQENDAPARESGPVTWHVSEGAPRLRLLTLADFADEAPPEFFMPDNTPLCPSISRKAALAVHFADPETGIYPIPVSPLECIIWLFLCAHHPDALRSPGYDAGQRLVVPLRDRLFDLRAAAEDWADRLNLDWDQWMELALTTWQGAHSTRVIPTQKKTEASGQETPSTGSTNTSGYYPEET